MVLVPGTQVHALCLSTPGSQSGYRTETLYKIRTTPYKYKYDSTLERVPRSTRTLKEVSEGR